jgi:hypothetical protein
MLSRTWKLVLPTFRALTESKRMAFKSGSAEGYHPQNGWDRKSFRWLSFQANHGAWARRDT